MNFCNRDRRTATEPVFICGGVGSGGAMLVSAFSSKVSSLASAWSSSSLVCGSVSRPRALQRLASTRAMVVCVCGWFARDWYSGYKTVWPRWLCIWLVGGVRELAVWVGVVLRRVTVTLTSVDSLIAANRSTIFSSSIESSILEVCCVFIGGETPDPLSIWRKHPTWVIGSAFYTTFPTSGTLESRTWRFHRSF